MRGGGADSGGVSKGGFRREGSLQKRDVSMDPRLDRFNSKSGSAIKEGAAQAPDKKRKSTVPAGPPTSAVHSTKLKRAADGGVQQEVVEEPTSDTATVGRSKDPRPQLEIVVTRPVPDVSPVRSPTRTPNVPLSIADNNRPEDPSMPVSPID